ncbi:salutaridinol 7-O-acetyltransferase-like [Solanum tuberosum]|uniref:salutaridinol 7-O-acetyltransferase-like n=1 Tax=Solanum tuberosum TaxID=4113 RepID=UPI00073A077D|nr:PREDICTED: salutaridinol 7-O-acetyltransferase-like [Solanum tuberosum]
MVTPTVLSGPQVSPPSNVGPKIVTKRFVFNAFAIANLKDRINLSATFTRPTRLVVVLSFLWKVIVGNSITRHGHSRGSSSLLFPINLRGKLNLPSLEHALGNLYVTVVASVEANQLRNELNGFVNVVGSKTRDTSASIGKANIDDITSIFPWYEADFGWGKPFWVSSVSKPFEVFILNDTKDGDGIEAWASLKENEMTEFERDSEILSYTSKVAFDSSMWIK